MAEDTQAKLGLIQADLFSLNESVESVNVQLEKIRSDVESNRVKLATQEAMVETMQRKVADMADRSWYCKVCVFGLLEGTEGSNAVQFLAKSLLKWFPTLSNMDSEIMPPHCLYSDPHIESQGCRQN